MHRLLLQMHDAILNDCHENTLKHRKQLYVTRQILVQDLTCLYLGLTLFVRQSGKIQESTNGIIKKVNPRAPWKGPVPKMTALRYL